MKLLFKLLILFYCVQLTACVSQSEYDKLQQDNNALKAELDEQKFGAGNLLKDAEAFYSAKEYEKAEEKLKLFLEKHSDKSEAIAARALQNTIQREKQVQAEESAWQMAQQSDDISYTESYLRDYPSGVHIVSARKRFTV